MLTTLSPTLTPPPILYSFRRCPFAIRARMAILATNRCVELREVDLKRKPKDMITLSAKGTVPVLVLPGGTRNQSKTLIIDESIDIMLWAQTGMSHRWPLAVPNSLTKRIDSTFKPALDVYKYRDRHDNKAVESAIATYKIILAELESLLEQHTWLSGNRFSFTDIAVFPFIRQLHFAGAKLLQPEENTLNGEQYCFTKLASWLQRLLASELFSRSMERFPVWNEIAPGPLFFRQMPSMRRIATVLSANKKAAENSRITKVHIAAFYRFTPIHDPQALKAALIEEIPDGVLGTILIAPEGVNGNIATSNKKDLTILLKKLASLIGTHALDPHLHNCNSMPFRSLKIRIKSEIVTFRTDSPVSFDGDASNSYIPPKEWNAVISDPDTIVIDTRNDYEISLGSFKGSVNPRTQSFGEFKDYVKNKLGNAKDTKVAMFCTGGIRCEKASRWMKSEGFSDVRQLSGGILGYLANIPKTESTWQGDCFVFDDRIAVDHDLRPTPMPTCSRCGVHYHPADGCPCTP